MNPSNEPSQFKLHSEYQPTGDQPQAIAELVEGFRQGNQFETLPVSYTHLTLPTKA